MKKTTNTPTLTKRSLVQRIAAELSIRQPDALRAVDIVFDEIAKTLVAGGHCEFRDFGVFQVSTRRARVGRNPHAPDALYDIPARRIAKFKSGKKLRLDLAASLRGAQPGA